MLPLCLQLPHSNFEGAIKILALSCPVLKNASGMPDTKVIPRGRRMQFRVAAEVSGSRSHLLYMHVWSLPGKGIQAISRYCEWDLARKARLPRHNPTHQP